MTKFYKLWFKPRFYTAHLMLLLIFTGSLFAQKAEIPYHHESYTLNSGIFDGDIESAAPVSKMFSDVVSVPGAPWLRLYFGVANLGDHSYLLLTSLKDGAQQKLTAAGLKAWQNSSAYFNGDGVRVELFVAAADRGIFAFVDEVMVGEWLKNDNGIESICGSTDERTASNDSAAGRIVPIGCTGWIIDNGLHLTAGHCLDGAGAQMLEFNVPPSLSNGTVQHPGPEDQYPTIASSYVFSNGGVGNDWGVFQVADNANTGQQPIQAQGASFTVVQDFSPTTIRITGYGVDGPAPNFGSGGPRDETNQTQQTDSGPNAGSSGTTMRYTVDTQGGNSGSPVIDDATGNALGIHTHGGCNSAGGNNSGTSAFNTAFWDAINVAQPLDPKSPTNVKALSDANSPTSILLNWTDPVTLIDGTPINSGDFTIEIQRDGASIASVNGGFQLFNDAGLTGGQSYTYTLFTKLTANDSTSSEVQVSWVAGGVEAIIWNPTELLKADEVVRRSKNSRRKILTRAEAQRLLVRQKESATEIANALSANNISNFTTVIFPSDLSSVSYFFIVLGQFSANKKIDANSTQALAIEDFIANGGNVYLEGGDTWYWDPLNNGSHDFGPTFGIDGTADGANGGELSTITGADIAAGQDFSYTPGSDNYPDHLVPIGSGVTIHSNTSPAFDCGIASAAAVLPRAAGNTIGTSFQFKDLIDGASPATKNELMASYLQFFGASTETSFSVSVTTGWNMIGRPLNVNDSSVTTLFPNHTPSSLFSYDGSYLAETHLSGDAGYWLNFLADESVLISGTPRTTSPISLNAGWNLIAGPSCSVPVTAIVDTSGVIVGTIWGWNGAYVAAASIDQGQGYWINASDSGTITMSCTSPLPKAAPALVELPNLQQESMLEISDAANASQTLYFGVNLKASAEKFSFSLPPAPPNPLFDARFVDDSFLTTQSSGEIRLQTANFPVRVKAVNLPGEGEIVLEAMLGNQVIREYRLRDGQSIEISNPQVHRLKLRKVASTAPKEFTVLENYPNPFNPTTEIRFTLPERLKVSVFVYNTLGQKVRTVLAAFREAGNHSVKWDGRNDAGQPVASGIYLYRVTAGQNSVIKKMILLK